LQNLENYEVLKFGENFKTLANTKNFRDQRTLTEITPISEGASGAAGTDSERTLSLSGRQAVLGAMYVVSLWERQVAVGRSNLDRRSLNRLRPRTTIQCLDG
jgi:hypothetical protein